MTIQKFESLDDLARFARKARGYMLTQKDIAEKSGWSQANVRKLETDGYGRGEVSLISAKEIFQALGWRMVITLEEIKQ